MLRVTMDNVQQKRTIRPLYAHHQATPYAGFLEPSWDRSKDIYPGCVMAKVAGEQFTLCQGEDANLRPFGLAAQFVAPRLGIDELRNIGNNVFAVWVGSNQSVFEVLAPAFDTTANWQNPTDGSDVPLYANADGRLTPVKGADGTAGGHVAARLIQVVGTNKIIVSLDRKADA